jgi:hypothetical protein
MFPIDVIVLDGPLARTEGLTVEMPMPGEPWPEAKLLLRNPSWRALLYRFETMSKGLPSLPVYRFAATNAQ